jgi:hypothetical protein
MRCSGRAVAEWRLAADLGVRRTLGPLSASEDAPDLS